MVGSKVVGSVRNSPFQGRSYVIVHGCGDEKHILYLYASYTIPETNITYENEWLEVGRLLSYWEGLFSGGMLVLGSVHIYSKICWALPKHWFSVDNEGKVLKSKTVMTIFPL